MQLQQGKLLRAQVWADGNLMFAEAPMCHATRDFFLSIPGHLWDGRACRWQFPLRPFPAWAVLNRCPFPVDATADIHGVARQFIRFDWRDRIDVQPDCRAADSWQHQRGGYWFCMAREAAMLGMWMGCGKSKCAVDLVINRGCRKALVACPVSVMGVWRGQFREWAGRPVEIMVLDQWWSGARKATEADKFIAQCEARGLTAVVVCNYESLSAGYSARKSKALAAWALKHEWDAVVADESQWIKGPHSKVGKFFGKLGRRARFRLCLTGTPLHHSPLDIWGQFRFLNPDVLGESWAAFRQRYAITGKYGADHIVDYKNLDELGEIIDLMCFRAGKDVLDLPELIEQECEFDLAPGAQQVYDELRHELIAEFADGRVVTAANGLVKGLRLNQVTSGFVTLDEEDYEANREIRRLDNAKGARLEELLDGIPLDEPVVVFCRFRPDLDLIEEIARKTGRAYGEVSGRRKDLTRHSKMPDDVRLMGVQIRSGGVGIDLTAARYGVFYSTGHSLGDFEQALARLHRPGQTRTTFLFHLVARGTIDRVIYRGLVKRKELTEEVLSYLKGVDDGSV